MSAKSTRTHLFVLRLWREATQPPQTDWRGSVTHAVTGETRYFRDVAGLYAALERILNNSATDDDPPPA